MATTVCLIDDDELARAHMSHMLEAEGFTVYEAATARHGLEIVAERHPEVVLIDLIMPDQDGLETIAALRRQWPQMRIVAISGGGRVGPVLYLDLARKLGASACLPKPLSIDLFKHVLMLENQAQASNATPR